MTTATVKQYIKTAPFKDVLELEKMFLARRRAEREKSEIDAAIKRGLADVKAGRVVSADDVKKRLREHITELEKKKCLAPTA
jgi:predicted transcriptional regulator